MTNISDDGVERSISGFDTEVGGLHSSSPTLQSTGFAIPQISRRLSGIAAALQIVSQSGTLHGDFISGVSLNAVSKFSLGTEGSPKIFIAATTLGLISLGSSTVEIEVESHSKSVV